MTLAVSIAQSGANNVTMRNRIINGNMVIDQRNAGAAVTISGDPGSYITDRWNGYKGGSTNNYTAQQSTTVPTGNFTNSLIITTGTGTSTGSTDYAGIQQKIEGYNFADIGWGTANAQPVTASFWVRSSVTGTFGVTFRNAAANATYCGTYVISSANTWTFCSVTVPAYTSGTWVTNNGVGVTFGFDLGVGSTYSGTANQWNAGANYFGVAGTTKLTQTTGATFYITGVQLEAGTTATAFEQRLYGQELALCQRYYYKEPSASYHPAILDGNSSDYVDAWVFHPVEMRATPSTVFETTGAFYYNSGLAGASFTPSGGTTSFSGTARSGYSIKNLISNPAGSSQIQKVGQWSVQLSFSAEL